jgi:hypothetical protein
MSRLRSFEPLNIFNLVMPELQSKLPSYPLIIY